MPFRGNGHWRRCPSLDYIGRNYWRINRMHQPELDWRFASSSVVWWDQGSPNSLLTVLPWSQWNRFPSENHPIPVRRRGERCRCAQFRSREQIRLSWKNFGVLWHSIGDWPESIVRKSFPSFVPFCLGWTLYNRCSRVWYTAIYTGT